MQIPSRFFNELAKENANELVFQSAAIMQIYEEAATRLQNEECLQKLRYSQQVQGQSYRKVPVKQK